MWWTVVEKSALRESVRLIAVVDGGSWTSRGRWIMAGSVDVARPRRLRRQGDVDRCEMRGGLRAGLEAARDGADRVQDGGVVAVERAGDLGEGERGELAGEVHRELPRPDDPGGARGRRGGPRGRPRAAQTASWIASSVGGSAAARGAIGRRRRPSARRTRAEVSGSPSSEAKAITRVIAPSSARTLAGAAAAISLQDAPASGGSTARSVAIRQRSGDPGAQVGWSELDAQAPVEAVAQALGEPRRAPRAAGRSRARSACRPREAR